MEIKCIVLYLLALQGLAEHTYYGSASDYYDDAEDLDPYVNWDKNYLCNGEFEEPQVPTTHDHLMLKTIPCWSGTKEEVEIGKGTFYEDTMKTQVMELATTSKNWKQGYQQPVNLTKGAYTLKFDYAPKKLNPPHSSTFFVFFNGREITKIRPVVKGVQTEILTVRGKQGLNIVEFVDATEDPAHGAVIDNVGLYEWKINKVRTKEVDAVAVGGTVTWSTVLSIHHVTSQLDKDESSRGQVNTGWCPLSHKTIGNWIQVSTQGLKQFFPQPQTMKLGHHSGPPRPRAAREEVQAHVQCRWLLL